ncbi:MAG: sugar ABC transporter permease [Actinomycetota bacterium]|nr:sugar ABC transporter permease [Actinomycetota bacterium]
MLAPYVLGIVALVLIPFLVTIVMAFADYDLVRAPSWVGLDNFVELADDPIFRAALSNSLLFAAIAVPLRLLIALGLALLLHRRAAAVGTARTAAMLPYAVPEIAYGLLWLWLLNPLYGPINQLLRVGGENGATVLGRTPPQWLTDPVDARAAIILMSLFTIGETFVILLATRRALPGEVYELAAIEDATGWDVVRRVTLPLMAPVLVLLLLRDAILSLQISFVPALVVTDGGPPPYSTTYLSLFVYRNAFEYLRYGYAAAATAVMLLLTLAAVALQWRLVRRLRWLGRT